MGDGGGSFYDGHDGCRGSGLRKAVPLLYDREYGAPDRTRFSNKSGRSEDPGEPAYTLVRGLGANYDWGFPDMGCGVGSYPPAQGTHNG